jgi:Zn-dependent protease with chaperone function
MALVSELDFEGFVSLRRAELLGGTSQSRGGHDYAYISDRQTRATFEKMKPVELAVAASVRMYKQVFRNQLLGNAVKVSERQFPRIHNLAKQCADTLQIAQPQLYIVSSPVLNAMTFGTNEESVVIVHSALVDHYSDEELLTVIGHECGHIHNSHVVYLTALNFLTQVGGAVTRLFAEPAILALRAWSRRAEITCDRAGMLCSKNADASARALTKLVLGSRKLYDEFNMDAFLDQHAEGRDGVGKYMEAFASHPWLPKRVLAMRVFGESELYRKAIGGGAGGLSIQEVDDKVRALLKGDA